jgi:SHS2 domain-containing protein
MRHRLLVDVKAVTMHRLRVVFENNVWRATAVLDI